MTTTPNDQSSTSNPISVLGEALEAAAGSVHDARADATASAKIAAAKVQSGIGKGAYYTAYGVSYGVVFSGVFLKELLPADSSIRRGFEEGGQDGTKAAIGAVARIHALTEEEEGEDDFVQTEAPVEPSLA
jgi:hypothetical protein